MTASRLPQADDGRVRKLRQIAVLLAAIIVVSGLHYLTSPSYTVWHSIYQRLYYGPVILGAYWFGVRGGLLTALATSLAYIPHIEMTWSFSPPYEASQYVEVVMFYVAGLFVGVLADHQRHLTTRYQRAATALERANRDLQESHAQLAHADRLSALGEMAAGLAHELRNPLASVNGAVEILAGAASEGTPQAEFAGVAKKELQRLDDLLTRFLAYARPHPPAFRRAGLGPIIDHVAALLRPEVERQKVTIEIDREPAWPELRVDPEQIEQVFLNVLLNAIQASPRGTTVEVRHQLEAHHVAVEVTDQGPGVPAEDLERIFDPFFTTKKSGTGLGLAVTARIVNAHGGSIDVQRLDNARTRVRIRLPLASRATESRPPSGIRS